MKAKCGDCGKVYEEDRANPYDSCLSYVCPECVAEEEEEEED